MTVGEGLSVAALLLSLLTILAGWASLQQKARGSYVDELAKEVELLQKRVAACENRWKAADLEIARLQAENDALRIDNMMGAETHPPSYGEKEIARGQAAARRRRTKGD